MNAVEYIYKMFFRKKKCIVMCTLELQQTVFTLSFIVAHLLSFPPRREKDHLSRLGLFKKFSKKNLGEQSLIGKLEVIGYGLLGFPGFQEIEILACHCQGGFEKALIRWLLHIRLEEHTKVFKVFFWKLP